VASDCCCCGSIFQKFRQASGVELIEIQGNVLLLSPSPFRWNRCQENPFGGWLVDCLAVCQPLDDEECLSVCPLNVLLDLSQYTPRYIIPRNGSFCRSET